MRGFGAPGDPVDGVSQVHDALPDAEGPADGAERADQGHWPASTSGGATG